MNVLGIRWHFMSQNVSENKGTWTGLCRRQEFDKQMEGKSFSQKESCIHIKNTEKQE